MTSAAGAPTRLEHIGLPILVFLFAAVVYILSPVTTVTDSYWTIYTAVGLIEHGDARLDQYGTALERADGFQVDVRDGQSYGSVPIATALFAVPPTAVALLVDGDAVRAELDRGDQPSLDPLVASLVSAAAVAVVFLFSRRASASSLVALVVAGVFALGTAAWSTASRAMWMHGPSMLLVALAVLLWPRVAARKGKGVDAYWLGVVIATAYFVRPTNAVLVAAVLVWAAVVRRDLLVRLAVGCAAATGFFLALNTLVIGTPLPPYVRSGRLEVTHLVPEALAGNLASPARGLLVFSPVLLFAGVGFVLKLRSRRLGSVDVALAAVVVGQWVVISLFPHWWGGFSFGPRFWTDVLPVLAWFLVPVVARCLDPTARSTADHVLRGAFLVLAVASIWINARGAVRPQTFEWNWTPVSVDADPSRVWDWSDLQFRR